MLTPIEISALVGTGALVLGLLTYGVNSWKAKRGEVMEVVVNLESIQNWAAREIVRKAALKKTALTEGETEEFISAAFQLMWAIQRVLVPRNTLKRSAIADIEGRLLYLHLADITKNLHTAMQSHGQGVLWDPVKTDTNAALEKLPTGIRNPWDRETAIKEVTLL